MEKKIKWINNYRLFSDCFFSKSEENKKLKQSNATKPIVKKNCKIKSNLKKIAKNLLNQKPGNLFTFLISPIFLKKCKNLRKQRDKTFCRNFCRKPSKNFGKKRNKWINNYPLFLEFFFKNQKKLRNKKKATRQNVLSKILKNK